MSKHKRLKAARRKQHNKTAKVRAREWAEQREVMRIEGEAARARRMAEAASETKNAEPLPPVDPLSKLLEGYLDGDQVIPTGTSQDLRNLMQALPMLFHKDGTLDLFEIAKRKLPLIDTEGPLPDLPSFKIGNPNGNHTEQCRANHQARVDEAIRIEQDLISKGEEALACYLRPTFMMCTCNNKPEDEDGSASA